MKRFAVPTLVAAFAIPATVSANESGESGKTKLTAPIVETLPVTETRGRTSIPPVALLGALAALALIAAADSSDGT